MSEETKAKLEPYYKKHYRLVTEALAELDIQLKDGLLSEPGMPKTTIKDAIVAVGAHLSKKGHAPIPQHIVANLIIDWVKDESKKQYSELCQNIAYSAEAPDRWSDFMQVTFAKNDDCDRWALKHQVWLMKRRILGLQVDERHRPMLLNIEGAPGQGKTLLLNEYLFKPLPNNRRFTASDMSLYMDERHYDIFGEVYALVFTETGKGEKVNVEQLKQLIDTGILGRRDLGHNSYSSIRNNATLFGTSNRRLRDLLKEENPRKWYEIHFPTRTVDELQQYITQRDQIPVHDLWRCIDETKDSELIQHWDAIQARILSVCAYVPLVEKWLLEYVANRGDTIVGEPLQLWRDYKDAVPSEYAVSANKLRAKAEALGFEYKRTKHQGRVYFLSADAYKSVCERYKQVFDCEPEPEPEPDPQTDAPRILRAKLFKEAA